jgi:hypothetical protein
MERPSAEVTGSRRPRKWGSAGQLVRFDDGVRFCPALLLRGLLGQVDNRRVDSRLLDSVNSLVRVGFGLICLAGGDNLAVGGREVEAVLARLTIQLTRQRPRRSILWSIETLS